MRKMIGEKDGKAMRDELGQYFSDDEIDVYFAAVNSAEVFARAALIGYENFITNYCDSDDVPASNIAEEMADALIGVAGDTPRHALDFGRLIGRDAGFILGMCEQTHRDVDVTLQEKFGWVPGMMNQRILEQKETGTYRPVYETDTY